MCGGSGCGGVIGPVLAIAGSIVAPELAPVFLSDAIGEAAAVGLTGAVLGGASSALTGGNPFLGAALGGVGGYINGAGGFDKAFDSLGLGGAGPGTAAVDTASGTALNAEMNPVTSQAPFAGSGANEVSPGSITAQSAPADVTTIAPNAEMAAAGMSPQDQAIAANMSSTNMSAPGLPASNGFQSQAMKNDSSGIMGMIKKNPMLAAGLGIAALTALSGGQSQPKTQDYRLPSQQAQGAAQANAISNIGPLNRQLTPPSSAYYKNAGSLPETAFFSHNPGFTTIPQVAGGGALRLAMGGQVMPGDSPVMYNSQRLDRGGKVVGPGGGMDDFVPATIEGQQPALLSNDEHVIPADVVSALGDGSSDAGHKKLYKLAAGVRKVKHGTTKQPDKLKRGIGSFL